jgi:folylpolyglutamate synthase/dihydropteroate synthase
VGLLAGREATLLARPLAELGATAIIAPPASERAADLEEVTTAFREAGILVQNQSGVTKALKLACDLATAQGSVLVVGSLYTVSEAREHLLGISGDRTFGLR